MQIDNEPGSLTKELGVSLSHQFDRSSISSPRSKKLRVKTTGQKQANTCKCGLEGKLRQLIYPVARVVYPVTRLCSFNLGRDVGGSDD